MAEESKHDHKREPYHLDTMKALLEKWETEHLNNIKTQTANHELGQLAEAIRQIGTRISRKMQGEMRNKCAACTKPLSDLRGPYQTIPVYDVNTSNYVNQYACSQKCTEVLQERARKAQDVLLTGH